MRLPDPPSNPPSPTQEHAAVSGPAAGPDDIVANLRQQVSELELTVEQLEDFARAIKNEVDRLDPDHAGSSSQNPISQHIGEILTKYEEKKEICNSFVNAIPKELKSEAVKNGRNLVMPLLSEVLSGLGGVHWLGIAFTFMGWSLRTINDTRKNRKDCIALLRRSWRLLETTTTIWRAFNYDTKKEELHVSVEIAVRCAIFCARSLNESWILRALKVNTIKDAIKALGVEIDTANNSNLTYISLHNLQRTVERQVTFEVSKNHIVGQRNVIEEALKFLEAPSDGLKAVLLYGMGGIGKSTLAMNIFSEFQKDSSYRACRVELPGYTQPVHFNLWDIQRQIIEKVCQYAAPKFSNLKDGKRHLKKELQKISQYPIFLYVDNILDHTELTKLLPKASHFPRGSKLVITSRGSHTDGFSRLHISEASYKAIKVKKLQTEEAKQLLWKSLGSKAEKHMSNGEIESLKDRVLAQYCDGLPLAIKVVGGYIRANCDNTLEHKNVEVWRRVVKSMDEGKSFDGGKSDEIYSRLEFSIQELDNDLKQAFLDLVFVLYLRRPADPYLDLDQTPSPYLVFRRPTSDPDLSLRRPSRFNNMDTLVRVVGSRTNMDDLCKRCLVQRTEEMDTLEVHDVLMALGRRIYRNEKEEVRISESSELTDQSEHNRRVVALYGVTVHALQLQQMRDLRVLIDVHVEGKRESHIKLTKLRIADGLFCSGAGVFDWSACKSLKHIRWGKSGQAPSVSNLEIFKHENIYSSLEVLNLHQWKGLKDVQLVENLTSLKVLQLEGCDRIESLPEEISKLGGLQVLRLSECRKLKGLPESTSRLASLEVLYLGWCDSIQSLPDGLMLLTALKELYLIECKALQSMGNWTAGMQVALDDGERHIPSMQEGGGIITKLSLSIRCASIHDLPKGISKLTGLRLLDLSNCENLQALPDGILTSLTGLTWLDLRHCTSLQGFPEGIENLQALTHLWMSGCETLHLIPQGIVKLTNLKLLALSDYKFGRRVLPDGLTALTGLTVLNMTNCESLQGIEGEFEKE